MKCFPRDNGDIRKPEQMQTPILFKKSSGDHSDLKKEPSRERWFPCRESAGGRSGSRGPLLTFGLKDRAGRLSRRSGLHLFWFSDVSIITWDNPGSEGNSLSDEPSSARFLKGGGRVDSSSCVFALLGDPFIRKLGLYNAQDDSVVGRHNCPTRSKINYFADTPPFANPGVLSIKVGFLADSW
jgi:hypothetical protein